MFLLKIIVFLSENVNFFSGYIIYKAEKKSIFEDFYNEKVNFCNEFA